MTGNATFTMVTSIPTTNRLMQHMLRIRFGWVDLSPTPVRDVLVGVFAFGNVPPPYRCAHRGGEFKMLFALPCRFNGEIEGANYERLRKKSWRGRGSFPQRLKPHPFAIVYVRPKGRTLQKHWVFQQPAKECSPARVLVAGANGARVTPGACSTCSAHPPIRRTVR